MNDRSRADGAKRPTQSLPYELEWRCKQIRTKVGLSWLTSSKEYECGEALKDGAEAVARHVFGEEFRLSLRMHQGVAKAEARHVYTALPYIRIWDPATCALPAEAVESFWRDDVEWHEKSSTLMASMRRLLLEGCEQHLIPRKDAARLLDQLELSIRSTIALRFSAPAQDRVAAQQRTPAR